MTFNSDQSAESLDSKMRFSRASLRGFIVVIVIALLIGFFIGRCTAPSTPSKPAANVTVSSRANTQARRGKNSTLIANAKTVPANVMSTLEKIDAEAWPSQGDSETHGGTIWNNREHQLPTKDEQGRVIIYREWDVNRKTRYHQRDGQRIITGSDNSAYYTLDHYRTLRRIR